MRYMREGVLGCDFRCDEVRCAFWREGDTKHPWIPKEASRSYCSCFNHKFELLLQLSTSIMIAGTPAVSAVP